MCIKRNLSSGLLRCQRQKFYFVGLENDKRLRRRHYNPVIIGRTIGLVIGPSTALCSLCLLHYTLSNKTVGSFPNCLRHGPSMSTPLIFSWDSSSIWTRSFQINLQLLNSLLQLYKNFANEVVFHVQKESYNQQKFFLYTPDSCCCFWNKIMSLSQQVFFPSVNECISITYCLNIQIFTFC